MKRPLAVAIALVCALVATSAHATKYKPRTDSQTGIQCIFDNDGHQVCREGISRTSESRIASARYDRGGVIGGRPAGCPYRYCGCEASRYVFGRMIPDLYLATNWIRKFPRTAPAPGMAAARNHHVFVLISHVSGSDWLVHDGNSGGGKTRVHVRSIARYVVVNPHGSRLAMR